MRRAVGFRRIAVWLSLVVAIFLLVVGIQPTQAAPAPVDLFQAQAEGTLGVGFVPADEKHGLLLLQNRTLELMVVQIPDEMAAVPVLAQQPPGVVQQPQRLGVNIPSNILSVLAQQLPGPPAAQPGTDGVNALPMSRTITLAPRGVLRIPTLGVCLDLGNPTPNARMSYQLVQVQQLSRDPRLAKTIRSLGQGPYDQPTVQAVAWYLSNGKTRQQLAKLRNEYGRSWFNAQQLQLAAQLLAEVSAPDRPATPEPDKPATPVTPAPSPVSLELNTTNIKKRLEAKDDGGEAQHQEKQAAAHKQHQVEQAKSEAAMWRTWTSADGQHTVEAKYSGMINTTVKLIKRDGSFIRLPLEKLSDEDQEFIKKRKGKEPKPASP